MTAALDSAFIRNALGQTLRGAGGSDSRFAGAAIDSRAVRPGDLFVALPGERVDGHDFAVAAIAGGAAGCLLERPVEGLGGVATFIVDDTLAALQTLGQAWRTRLDHIDVVGITGNVGKTTTKLITAAVLGTRYRVQASPLNYNNEISVPLCLLDLKPESERAVIEMGMYTTGEIALLCEWTRPRIGAVLNVGPVHLERAGSMDAIIRAKRELPESLPSSGHAVLNADDPDVRTMARFTEAQVWLFGDSAECDVRGDGLVSRGAEGFEFTLAALGKEQRVRVPLVGSYLLSNVLAAATIAIADGLTFGEVVDAIEGLSVQARLQVVDLPGDVTLLDDTYNANPASTLGALDLLAEMDGRRLALLGDMRELGSESDAAHDRVGRRAAGVLDELITVGELARGIADGARAEGLRRVTTLEDKADAARELAERLGPGDVVLIKGSHALALETVVDELRRTLEARA